MNYLWRKISTKVPEEYKEEFERQLVKDNFSRIAIFAVILFSIELIIYYVVGPLFGAGTVISKFIISNLITLPLIILIFMKVHRVHILLAKTIQYLYAVSVLLLGVFLVLVSQGEADFVHMYLMTVFGVTLIINMMPIESLILLSLTYFAFFFLLPFYQQNTEMVVVIRENTFIFNIFAWLESRMVLKMRLNLFLDKKVIQQKNCHLEEMVQKDSMTGLFNHATSFELLSKEMDRAKRIGYPLSMILMDIDDFKKVNDDFGHQIGDSVIVKVAETIRNTVRSTDLVGRYGGEEFIIIMPNTNTEEAQIVVDKIQVKINCFGFKVDSVITLSGGITQFTGETIDEFVRTTDKKLYRAKSAGKDRFVI